MVIMMESKYDPKLVEKKWQKFWADNQIYKFNTESEKPVFSIDTPPPTVSGGMHLGHALSYTHADFIARFWRMMGYNVFYPFGFDDNGLATERLVEKKINMNSSDMTREEFIKLCLEKTKEAEKELKRQFTLIGLSVDWSINYRTISDYCRKISQLSFLRLYKMGRVYQKETPFMWCPKCHTAIAQAELEDVEQATFFNDIIFETEDGKKLVISTTRPELLPACVAVFVHPEDERYKDYVGKKVIVPLFGHKVSILKDERVDPEKGTGIVMCCTFGDQTDMEWYQAHNLPLRIAITETGKMTKISGKYAGLKIEEARKKILEDLKNKKLLVKQIPITHSVNVHERCGTPIEFLVTKQWFIKYLDLKKELIKRAEEINWYPKHMKARYDHWINGLQWDWCISRQRYFGVPFPLWYCKKCGSVILADEEQLPVDPLRDKPNRKCKCGSDEFIPEKDVLDTWATSSLTPQITLKWGSDFFNKNFPMSLRPQAHDIITLWAFNTIVKSILHENKIPWKNIMISGHALDTYGKKMSKSKGNVIKPEDVINKYSVDCLRFWASQSKLGEDLPFMEKDLVTGQKFSIKLWNAARFILSHIKGKRTEKPEKIRPIDSWILTKLNKQIKKVTKMFKNYNYPGACHETVQFFWHDVCDNYLEMIKDRVYNKENYEEWEIQSAYFTLYKLLLTILKMMAPFMPHITEEIYHNYFSERENKKSIHISRWPSVDETLSNLEAEEAGNLAVDIISSVRKYKTENNISMNAPLNKIIINCKKTEEDVLKLVVKDIKTTAKANSIEFGPASKITTENFGMTLNIE